MHDPVTLHPEELIHAHEHATVEWHTAAGPLALEETIPSLSLQLHCANFILWHLEDEARDTSARDHIIVQCKRAIDRNNQQRNDLVERIDALLFDSLPQNGEAPLHSETPGQMLDRLSILSLKIYHMRVEVERLESSNDNRLRNRERLLMLTEQRDDLRQALESVLHEITAGTRRFKLYRQVKMYNDPQLNPVLYSADRGRRVQ